MSLATLAYKYCSTKHTHTQCTGTFKLSSKTATKFKWSYKGLITQTTEHREMNSLKIFSTSGLSKHYYQFHLDDYYYLMWGNKNNYNYNTEKSF
jgi:hypothetical protein